MILVDCAIYTRHTQFFKVSFPAAAAAAGSSAAAAAPKRECVKREREREQAALPLRMAVEVCVRARVGGKETGGISHGELRTMCGN